MKNIYAGLLLLVCSINSISRAQQSEFLGYSTVYQSTMINFEMPKNLDSSALIKPNFKGREDVPGFDNSPHLPDLVWQQHENLNKAVSATLNWSVAGVGANLSPPDPTGDADSLVYIQGTNGSGGGIYRILNKFTGAILNSSLTMQTLGGPTGNGDPIILYHKPTRQWIITEFSTSGNKLIVHVSPVGSYTGTYFTSTFTCPSFPDYPKYSIYSDANALLATSNEGGGSPVYAIKLSAVLAGTTSPFLRTTVPDLSNFGFQAITPVDLEGDVAFPSSQKPMFIRHKDDEVHSGGATAGTDQLEIWEANINWTGAGTISIAKTQTILVADFDSDLCGLVSFNCFPQPGTSNKLDPLREQVMYKPVVRIFPTHQAMVLAFTTDVSGTNRGGVRWVELRRPTGSITTWTKYQEGTYAPGTTNRWMPSINIDKNGSILLAYSTSSSTAGDFPSLRYTGRKACDALGTMTIPEGTIIAGSSSKGGDTRWGDYFHMAIDPFDEETFYFTGIYVAAGGSTQSRIASIKIDKDANDAKLVQAELITPSPICNNNVNIGLTVQNFGTSTLTSGSIKHQVNGGGFNSQTFATTLSTDATSIVNIAVSGIVNGVNVVKFIVENANGTIPDDNNCNDTLIFTFNAVTNIGSLSATSSPATCGSSNGAVSASLIGGLANGNLLTYTINGTSNQSSGNFSGLIAGNYIASVTDPAGCVISAPSVAVAVGIAVTATQSQTNINCFGQSTGTASVTASGGLIPYSYLWDNGANTASTTGLTIGDHTCTITDANGCTNIQSVNISQIAQISATSTSVNATCGISNGSATLVPSGGNGPYTYLWANATTTSTLSSVNSGMYSCIITDANACSVSKSVMIGNISGPSLSITTNTPSFCFQDPSGEVAATVISGTAPYAYQWSPSGGVTNTASGLLAGDYTCQVTDGSGCVSFITATVTEPLAITADLTVTNFSCGGSGTGSITAAVANTVGAVNYAWSTGETSPTGINNLFAFTYSLTVTDSRGCTASDVATVPNEPTPTFATFVKTDATCFGTSTGSASMSATGGVAPYTYLWSGTGGVSTLSNPLAAGTYTATITGANGCPVSYSFNILEPSQITVTATATSATCFGGSGSMAVSASGGNGTYIYNIGAVTNSTGNFSSLLANPYLVTVTDGNNCSVTTTQTVSQAPAITINAIPTAISCFGANNGSIQVIASGGTGGFTYSRNGTSFQGSAIFSSLGVGNYTVYAKDVNGCIKTFVTSITQPAVVVLTGVSTVSSGANDATITLTGSGGMSPYTYSVNGSPFGSSTLFSNLGAGSYTCVIKDDNGCTKTITIVVGTAGVEENAKEEVTFESIFPNPSTGQFTLNLKNVESDIDLRIFNTEGRMIAQFGVQNEKGDVTKVFELSNKIASGIYFLGIYENEKQPKIVSIQKI